MGMLNRCACSVVHVGQVRPLFAVELLQKFNLTVGTEKLEKSTVDRRTRSGEEVREKSVNLP